MAAGAAGIAAGQADRTVVEVVRAAGPATVALRAVVARPVPARHPGVSTTAAARGPVGASCGFLAGSEPASVAHAENRS